MRLLAAALVATSASRVVQFQEAAEGSAVHLVPAAGALGAPARLARLARAPDPVAFLHELPRVQYTVPSAPRGWKGRPEAGEDPDVWYDAQGPRNGPPPNYWRQAMDERQHELSMDALRVALGEGPADTSPVWTEFFDAKLRMGIRNPLRNRKILGSWVPIVLNGRRVATNEGAALDTPLTITFARADPSPRMQIHRYGVFEDHLDPGEEVEVTVEGEAGVTESVRVTPGDRKAPREALPLKLPDGEALHLGGVTLLSDYLLVARDAEGGVQDVLMRVTPASLDVPETNEPPFKFIARMQEKFPAARVSDPSAEKKKKEAPAEEKKVKA